ncbi:hypothetical protein [Tardiphaga sp.]|uniref:hypothetical protein n=1 Tax=Tardiphaga sp. TaxID=1926292 RepID=UPI002636447B|nr:hypothetical protein [Tardiphaga sp.]MDB5620651.1 hypothetical protein [Tardiphaga sp.]
MIVKFSAAKTFAVLLSAVAVLAVSLVASPADAATKRKARVYDRDAAYGQRGPNVSYQAGPRTRVYITKRSWLDAGVEVLPGDRKFNDYAFPPGQSFARENLNRPLDRQPLNSSWDLGGYPERFPLY